MKTFKGLMTPMITVFDKNDKVSKPGMIDQINFLIENGVDMIFPCGSTGEFSKLSIDERKNVLKIVVDEVNNKVPVFAGTAADSTKETIMHSKYAEDIGADGVVIVPSFYSKIREEGVYAHFKAISEKINIPIMIYNNPARSLIDVKPELISKLFEEGYVSYVKESSADVRRCSKLLKLSDKLGIFVGIDSVAVEALSMGASGWVSSSSNVIPRECSDIYDAVTTGDIEKAKKIFYRIYSFLEIVESGLLIGVCKGGLKLKNRDVGIPRMPILPLNASQTKSLKTTMENARII
jgi:4-hydroxy-tetrahydrodipicolinate synthase